MAMEVKARAEGKPSSGLTVPQPVQSLIRHKFNLCLMLELFDERLTRFERSLKGEGNRFEFAYVTVPEQHAKPGGPVIQVAVARFKSISDNPLPDPLVLRKLEN